MRDRLGFRGVVLFQWIGTVVLLSVVLVSSALARQCLGGLWKDTGTNENPELELTISGQTGQPQVVAKYTKVHRCRLPDDAAGHRRLLQYDFHGYLISRVHIAGILHMCKFENGRTIDYYDAPDLTLNLRDDGTLHGEATDLGGGTVSVTLEPLSRTSPTNGRCPEDSLPPLADQCEHAMATRPDWEQLSAVCRGQKYATGRPTDTTPGAGAPVRPATPDKKSPGEMLGDAVRELRESEQAAHGQH